MPIRPQRPQPSAHHPVPRRQRTSSSLTAFMEAQLARALADAQMQPTDDASRLRQQQALKICAATVHGRFRSLEEQIYGVVPPAPFDSLVHPSPRFAQVLEQIDRLCRVSAPVAYAEAMIKYRRGAALVLDESEVAAVIHRVAALAKQGDPAAVAVCAQAVRAWWEDAGQAV